MDTVVVILLFIIAITQTRTGARLVWYVGWNSAKFAWWLLRVIMMLLLLFGIEEAGPNGWGYHHGGALMYCWAEGIPKYSSLPPGAPDPMVDGQYKPGGPHLPVPDYYYTRGQWHHHAKRHCGPIVQTSPHRSKQVCTHPDEEIYTDD